MASLIPINDPFILCNQALKDFRKQYNMFKGIINGAKNKTKVVSDALRNLADTVDIPDLGGITSGLTDKVNNTIDTYNDFIDVVNAGDKLQDAFKSLLICLGEDKASKYLGIDFGSIFGGKLNKVPDPGKFAETILDGMLGAVDSALSELGNQFDGLISKGFNELESMMSKAFLDDLLRVIGCIEQYCKKSEVQATTIESKLESIGLSINNEIDFTSVAFTGIALTSEKKMYAKTLQSVSKSAKNTIRNSVKSIGFSPKRPGQEDTFLSSVGLLLVK